jgi:GT2 family glycosyltransferase
MAKVAIIQQVFNSRKWMELVYPAMVNQTFPDVEIIAQIVSDDGGCEDYIRTNFPQIKILKPGYNIGFAKGHNEIFASTDAEFFMLVNPDLIMEPNYVEQLLTVFTDPEVGAAQGKLLRYDLESYTKTNVFDSAGIVMSRNGRARSRGQHETDSGQYDERQDIIAVEGAAPMYRKAALEAAKYPRPDGRAEYFDEDFHSYWEDTDLGLRLWSAGFRSVYNPEAVAYHGRTAGSSKKGYRDVAGFVKHHQTLSGWIKQLNFKNHIFVSVKNFPRLYWKFFVREFFMLGYIVVFETSTLQIVPTLFRQLPLMLKKRKWIQQHRKSLEWVKLLNNKGLLE